jgi:nitroreductase
MYSARALRRLKPDPVPDDIITKILDAAIRAPSAGNSQHWAFVLVQRLKTSKEKPRSLETCEIPWRDHFLG